MMFEYIRLRKQVASLKGENEVLRKELEQKNTIIQYLNGCVNKANKRTIEIQKQLDLVTNVLVKKTEENIDFPNSSLAKQISIHNILEH